MTVFSSHRAFLEGKVAFVRTSSFEQALSSIRKSQSCASKEEKRAFAGGVHLLGVGAFGLASAAVCLRRGDMDGAGYMGLSGASLILMGAGVISSVRKNVLSRHSMA